MKRSFLIKPTVALIASLAPGTSFAQTSSASVSGVVEDASGGRLPRATISLVSLLNGAITTAQSTEDGGFLVPSLVPGSYSLQVACDGFTTVRLVGLTLNIGQSRQFRVRLSVRSTEQTVDVLADQPASASEGAEVSTVVSQQLVSNLPLAGRSFQDLVAMTPGLVLGTPQGALPGQFSVNGQPTDTNTYLVDGLSANFSTGPMQASIKVPAAGQYAALTTLGTTQGILALDALQEFRVVSSTANPEYGRGLGGFFALLSRGGDQLIHGSAYASVRNSFPDARDWFTRDNTYYHQQDIGVTASGPLLFWRPRGPADRTFFFGTYEELHVEQRSPVLGRYVPSASLIMQVPASVQAVLMAMPYGLGETSGDLLVDSSYPSTPNPPSFLRSQEYRLDRSLRERIHLFTHFGDHPSGSEARYLFTDSLVRSSIQSLSVGIDAQIAANRANELRGGFADDTTNLSSSDYRAFYSDGRKGQPYDIAASLGVPSSDTQAELFLRVPGIGQSSAFNDATKGRVRQFELRDAFSFQQGAHLIRIGVDYRDVHSDLWPLPQTIQANYLTPDALRLNRATAAVFRRSLPAHPVFRQFGFFSQDSWRIAQRLSVSLGLRWDISPAPSSADGRLPLTFNSVTKSDGVSLRDAARPLWSTDWSNLGPRLGAAWTVRNKPRRELVFHAGVGLLFGSAHQAAAELFSGLGYVASNVVVGAALPYSPAFPDSPSGTAELSSGLGYVVPRTLHSPWNLEWNASVEQAFGTKQILTVAAVGSSGPSRILTQRHLNTASEPPIKAYGSFAQARGNYTSLQLQWRGSARGGLTWMTAYTLSHAFDHDLVNPYQSPSYGVSATDVRHNLQTSLAWSVPTVWKRNIVSRAATERWGIDGRWFLRSAYPVTPVGEFQIDPVTGERLPTNVDLFVSQPLYVRDAGVPGGRRINGGPSNPFGAFRFPENGAFGNAPRNVARGTGAQELSLSVRRDVRLYSKLTLQIRGDLFNVTNTPDFGYVDTQLGDRLFGQAILSLNQSYGQTGSLYQPGGSRTIQWDFRVKW